MDICCEHQGVRRSGRDVCLDAFSRAARVVRSKGFVRILGSDKTYYWSHAGRQIKATAAEHGCSTSAGGQGSGAHIHELVRRTC